MASRRRALLLGVALLAASCTSTPADGAGDERIDTRPLVVTTVAPITSIAAAVIGDRAEVRGIVPEGVSSHTFEPPPSTAEVLSRADVVILNGLGLEEPTRRLAEATVEEGTPIVALGERTISVDEYRYDRSFPRADGRPNPHLWTNPPMVAAYAAIIRDQMMGLDPAHAEVYEANARSFAAEVDQLDRAMRIGFATVPRDHRKLLTYHDAYAYFAAEYGWEVVGAIQVADFEEPSAAEVVALIDQVRDEGVPVIFGSEEFPSPVLEQIGRETGARYVDVLRDDDLPGAPGDADHSLLSLLRDNAIVITEALGGDAGALEELDVTLAVADTARYP